MHRAGHSLVALVIASAALASSCVRTPAPPSPGAAPHALSYVAQFDSLWTRFEDVYPSFAYKQIDWREQRARFRPRAERARTQDELVAVMLEMLTPLRDLHVWLVDPRGQVVPTYRPAVVQNFDLTRWESALRDASYVPRSPGVGDGVVGGYAYLHIGTWKAPLDEGVLDGMLERARDAQGLIIDVRVNAGGSDALALSFASRFTRKAFAASYVRINTDPRVTGVEMPLARTITPKGAWQFTKPVVIISGRGGFSATESFVAAMRTLPQVTVIGDTTGGASGNPATYALGNGWQFTVPRWMEYGPDKQPIEWRGIAPHLAVAWTPTQYDRARDPLIDAAVGVLGERTGVYRMSTSNEGVVRQHDDPKEQPKEPSPDPRGRDERPFAPLFLVPPLR